jgi:uncharacterized protein (DUF1778 family)
MKKTYTIRLTPELHKEIKVAAANESLSLSAFMEQVFIKAIKFIPTMEVAHDIVGTSEAPATLHEEVASAPVETPPTIDTNIEQDIY